MNAEELESLLFEEVAETAPELEVPEEPIEEKTVSEPEVDETTEPTSEPEDTKVPLKALQEERRKRQEYEVRLREVEERISKPPVQETAPQTLEEYFDKDPKQVLSYIDQQIAVAEQEFDDAKTRQLERTRTRLLERRLFQQEDRTRADIFASQIESKLGQVAPEFASNRQAFIEAAKEMGYSDQSINVMLDPRQVGPFAVEQLGVIKKYMDSKNIGRSIKSKEIKTATQVQRAGNGMPKQDVNIAQLKEEARSSGNWDKYLEAVGALDY